MLGQLYYAVLKATSHSSQQLNHLHTYDDVSSVSNMYRDTAVSVDTNLNVESIQHSSQVSANLRIHMSYGFILLLLFCMCAVCIVRYCSHIVCIFSISVRLLNLLSFEPCNMGSQTNPKVSHVSQILLVLSSDLMP